MAGKKKAEKNAASQVAGVDKNSRQIWLAGLGAYARARTEGSQLFEGLVKEGEQAEAEARLSMTPPPVVKKGKAQPRPATQAVLDAGGVPVSAPGPAFDSRAEVAALKDKVDLIMRELERLTGAGAPGPVGTLDAPSPAKAKPGASKASPAKAVASATSQAAVMEPGAAEAAARQAVSAKPSTSKAGKATGKPAREAVSVAVEKKPRARKPGAKATGNGADSQPLQ